MKTNPWSMPEKKPYSWVVCASGAQEERVRSMKDKRKRRRVFFFIRGVFGGVRESDTKVVVWGYFMDEMGGGLNG